MRERDDLDAARLALPEGTETVGTVRPNDHAGRIGVFVDLAPPYVGFVDVLDLPEEAERWPPGGVVTGFEVTQHRRGQVRLWPLDAVYRSARDRRTMTAEQWAAAKHAHPVGSTVTAAVEHVFRSNREYVVRLDGLWVGLPWTADAEPPAVGDVGEYTVVRHAEATRRILLG